MRWNHLPVAGGLDDQDPDLLDKFDFLFRAVHEEEERKREEEKRKQDADQRKSGKKPGTARARRR